MPLSPSRASLAYSLRRLRTATRRESALLCGICGIAYSDASVEVESEVLTRMRRALAHRGPDGQGEQSAEGVGLAHARFSIIDVASGQQPLCNEDDTVWITFNGEIYNYLPLRRRLEAQEHVFRTRSDTEVLVHLYDELGPDLVRELNGMFAFAIHLDSTGSSACGVRLDRRGSRRAGTPPRHRGTLAAHE